MKMQKGLSTIVVTVLLVLLAIVALGIVWYVIRNVVENSKDADITEFKVTMEINKAQLVNNNAEVEVTVYRKTGTGNITGLRFVLFNGTSSQIYENMTGISELQTRIYKFPVTITNPVKVEIYPITIVNNKNRVLNKIVEKNFGAVTPVIISPEIDIEILSPTENINVVKYNNFDIKVKVTCLKTKCDNIKVSLDPEVAITNCNELQSMSLTGNYYLANNIDCSGINFQPIGDCYNGVGFTGNLDGRGYNISNLIVRVGSSVRREAGLFGCIDSSSSVIKNINLVNVDIYSSTDIVGGVGGLAGRVARGTITNCSVSGSVVGASQVGALVGTTGFGIIRDSYSTAGVSALKGGGYPYFGNLVGGGGNIFNSYSTGPVSGDYYVGGISGYTNTGNDIRNSFAIGDVYGNLDIGKFVGKIDVVNENPITNCYFYKKSGQPQNCYNGGNDGCTAITDINYFYDKAHAPMSSWDFVSTWKEVENNYPVLRFGNTTTLSKNGLVSNTVGAKPFFTNLTNPTTINLEENEYIELVYTVNATGLAGYDYEFFAYANISAISDVTNKFKVRII